MLELGHPEIQDWFWRIKRSFPDVHTSCIWRGEADQDDCFKRSTSPLEWPHSKHNTIVNGVGCSDAMDLFFLNGSKAEFPVARYAAVAKYLKEKGAPLIHGGSWKTKDHPHFERTQV